MNIEFPNYPTKYLSNQELRSSYAKARAYSIFYMEESGQEHSHDLTSAIATAEAHDINLELSAEEYLERALQEISYAEGILDESNDFRTELRKIRLKISEEKSDD